MDTYYLIAKNATRMIGFYDPAFFETCAPPNRARTRAVQTSKALFEAFKK
jgi:hypothetical protein